MRNRFVPNHWRPFAFMNVWPRYGVFLPLLLMLVLLVPVANGQDATPEATADVVVVTAEAMPAATTEAPAANVDARAATAEATAAATMAATVEVMPVATVEVDIAALLADGNMNLDTGHEEAALKDFADVLAVDAQNVDAIVGQVRAYISQGNDADALNLLDQALEDMPDNADLFAWRAVAHAYNGDNDLAVADAERAAEVDDTALSHYALGVTYSVADSLEQALAEIGRAVEIDPELDIAYNLMGRLYFDSARDEEATTAFTSAIELNPNDINSLFYRGQSYYYNGETELAIGDFDKAIALNSDWATLYDWRGFLAASLGNDEAAIADYTSAIEIDPQVSGTYYRRGSLYLDQPDGFEAAIADFDHVIELDPNDVDAYVSRGYAYYEIGDNENAMADYSSAIEIDPTNSLAYSNRGLLYQELGQDDLALADFSTIIDLDPQSADNYSSRGWAYLKMKEYSKALDDVDSMLAIDPEDGNAYHLRAVVFAEMGVPPSMAARDCLRALNLWEQSSNNVTVPAGGGSVSAGIDDDGQQVIFSFDGKVKDSVTLATTIDDAGSVDTLMLLMSPRGEPLACSDDVSEDDLSSRIESVTLTESGVYKVIVGSTGGAGTGDFGLDVDIK